MNQKELHNIFQQTVGKVVLQVNAGGSTGSIFSLDIGDRSLENEGDDHVQSESEFALMIYCSWRLFDLIRHKPITGWQEDSSWNGAMTLGLKALAEDVIEDILFSSFNDLVIKFKSGKILSVFCDLTTNKEWGTNWFLRANGKHYSINNSLDCVVE